MTSLRRTRLNLALALTASATFVLPAHASIDDEAQSTWVANANKAKECDFPPVVYVKGCTGTLVHPEIVVYAWHCGRPSSVKFTESGKGRGGFSVPAKCVTSPNGKTQNRDWAYCKLSKPVTEIPIVPVVQGCEYEMISKAGQEVVQVGFGKTHRSGAGVKYWGISEVTKVGGGVVTVGDKNSVVACPGDSGGPLMARMEDKSWRTIGILSTYNGRCGKGGVNWYSDAQKAISWIEESSGVDITPCFNDKGEWEPGPDCGGFYASDPGDAKGNWSNKCEGTAKSGRSSTCGPAQGGDDKKPETEVLSPKDGDILSSKDKIVVKVKASDNEKVKSVELFVDGASKGSKDKEPYEWELESLKSGQVKIKAVAKDSSGNEGESEEIEIKIKDEGAESGNGGESGDEPGENSGDDGGDDTEGSDSDSDSGSEDSDSDSSDSDSDSGDDSDSDSDSDSEGGDDSEGSNDPDGDKEPADDKKGCSVSSGQSGLLWLGALGLLVGFRRRQR